MFDHEFYPTPKPIIRKMLEGINRRDLDSITILEPSAGRGDIVDYLKGDISDEYSKMKIYVCEIDKDLQYQLQSKGYRLISEDFLEYNGDHYFDLIIMNPPFSSGADHFLKAWEILEEGSLICLLNAETIRNPYSEKRSLLEKIINDNGGTVEIIENGFSNAERATDVDVALIKVKKVAKGKSKLNFNFESGNESNAYNLEESMFKNEVAVRDVVGNMMIQFENLKEMYVEHLKIEDGLKFYSNGLFESSLRNIFEVIEESKKEVRLDEESDLNRNRKLYNEFCDRMKYEIWKTVINKMGMERYLTNNVRKNFSAFIEQQGAMEFTKENVMNLIKTIFANTKNIMETAITDVFDIFTKYHDENRCHVEGWKTNNSWKVNRKVILPYFVDATWGGYYHTNSNKWSEYSDIERVMCYLTGKNYDEFSELVKECEYSTKERDRFYKMESLSHAISNVKIGDSGLKDSEFFTFRCYKKGTLHITFKDEWLWEEFNLRATDGKKWLPDEIKVKWEKQNRTKKVA